MALGGTAFALAQELVTASLDYRYMRCAIVQWDTATGTLAAYVGSSVPHVSAITEKLATNGNGANRLCSGLFKALAVSLPGARHYGVEVDSAIA